MFCQNTIPTPSSIQALLQHLSQLLNSADLSENGLPTTALLTLGLIKVVLPNGRIEVLVTSLLDTERCPADSFGQLSIADGA